MNLSPTNQTASSVLVPGANFIGTVGASGLLCEANPVLTVAGLYIAGDYIGTSATAMTFANAARVAGGYGEIRGAALIDYALQSVAGELWLADTAFAGLPADNAAFTMTDAAAQRVFAVIPFSSYNVNALNSVCALGNLCLPFKCLAASTSLYGAFVTRGAPTYASLDLTFRLLGIQY